MDASNPASTAAESRRSPAKTIHVGLAVILGPQGVLVSRRHADAVLGGLWEFPGGKIEPGETPEQCVAREAREEVGLSVRAVEEIGCYEHGYDHGTVRLHAWWCSPDDPAAEPRALEVAEARWADARALADLKFPPANDRLLATVRARLAGG